VTCSACGKQTPSGFAFCQHCGQRLASAPAPATAPTPVVNPAPPTRNAMGVAPTMAVNPTPPAGMPRPGSSLTQPSARAPLPTPSPLLDQDEEEEDQALAHTMAPPPERTRPSLSAASVRAPLAAHPPANHGIHGAAHGPVKSDTVLDSPPSLGSLVALNRDGSDGDTVPLVGDAFDIGRTEGSLKFESDVYLAPRHARLVLHNGKVLLRPLDSVNGVYVRVQGTVELQPGDQFLVGKEVLRFEPLSPEERDPPSLVEHGVRIFGSAQREAWGRLRQLTSAGTSRDIWHLVRPELVLGREEGDVTFPDDEYMSRRHAAVKRSGPRARLEDLGSSNGTFVRVRHERELKAGDVLRMGDQLLRLEL
jgi:pSer/pThr/pTyr-binding forkhead associated (FHA) protein